MFRYILNLALLISFGLAQDCTITVPANPLTAAGLATPYTITGDGCSQRGCAPSFVECAIYSAGNLQIYAPLVVDQGDKPGVDFVPPIKPTVPNGATVGCWFGSNAASLTLTGPGSGQCVNGADGTVFGQFATCGGAAFFTVSLG
jgi:hypothetical protein